MNSIIFQNFINDIDTYTLWDPINLKYPDIGHIKIPGNFKRYKGFTYEHTMAELPVVSILQHMEKSPWVGSIWFYLLWGSDRNKAVLAETVLIV